MELRILSGLHRGAALEIDEDVGSLAIGASPDGDVLLADPGVARLHCRVSLQAGRWHIEPVEGRVFDRRGRAIAAATPIERGHTYRLADVWIGFFDATDAWGDAAPAATPAPDVQMPRYPRAKAPVIAVAVAAALALPAAWFVSAAWGRATDQRAKPATAEAQVTVPREPNQPVSPAKLAEEFTRQLSERELKDRLELRLQPDHWEIRGSLDSDEQQRFERMLVRFFETRKPAFPIKVSLVAPAELLPFKVVEVISGKGAGIVTDSGERLHVGDTHQGWRLSTVESGKVVFTGRQRVEIAL